MRKLLNKNIKSDNRGATMVMVLIAIAFITILGAILLFTSYTGYRIKVSQAVGENRFYDAETAMDEVRAGMQGVVSDSISRAYTNLMTGYDGVADLDDDFVDAFKNEFLSVTDSIFYFPSGIQDINAYLPATAFEAAAYPRFQPGVEIDVTALSAFITDSANTELTFSNPICGCLTPNPAHNQVYIEGRWIPSGATGHFVVDGITMKGLRVTHTTDDGYLSIVDTDIALDIPSLTYSHSMLSFRLIADFAFIATGVMDAPAAAASGITIDGNVYTGSIELNGGGPVTFSRGMLISGGDGTGPNPLADYPNGDIVVINNSFTANAGTTVWARNIRVGRTTIADTLTGSVSLLGSTNLAGSLILDGTRTSTAGDTTTIAGSNAVLAGQFYGFGTGKAHPLDPDPNEPGGVPLNPQLSSSIIVNGRHSDLRLQGLNRLFLAGQSFIEATGVDVATGQSIAVRSDQLAYLIPPALISNMVSNPVVYNNPDDIVAPEIDFTAPLWEGSSRSLSDYVNAGSSGYHQVIYPLPGDTEQVVFYVFMQFPDIDSANNYFLDYFQNNATGIRNYTNIYLDWYTTASNVQSEGVIYTDETTVTNNPDGTQTTTQTLNVAPRQTGPITALRFFEEYENRRRTLTREYVTHDFSSAPDENPFHYIVLSQPPAGYYTFEGNQTAFVHHGPGPLYLDLAAFPDLANIKIIISYGDVYVNTPYDGLILCDGNIHVNQNVAATHSSALRTALLGVNPADAATGKRLGDYLNISMSDATDDDKGETWDFTQLIYFDNWSKN